MNRSKSEILLSYAVLLLAAATLFSACGGGGGGGGGGGAQAPAKPTNLSATAISTAQIDLAWDDAANDKAGFRIERSLDGKNFSMLTIISSSNTTTFSDTGLSSSTTYFYRVAAYNSAGSNSAYSDIANARTTTVSTVVGPSEIIVSGITTTLPVSGSSDGATGAEARFNYPRGVTTSISGDIYVADTMNHTIREINSSGMVITLAGTALASGVTDSTGAAARFNQPSGITVNGTDLYVADTMNHTIRKIDSSGDVTTLAGSPQTAGYSNSTDGTGKTAQFNQPSGIATDGANLYVADTMNHIIRQIVISSGSVTTLAGSALVSGSTDSMGTAARFNQPSGIAVDSSGKLYVSDTMNHTIRQIIISAGTVSVTTLAGSAGKPGNNDSTDGTGGTARFKQPSGISTDDTYLYVTDTGNNTIRKVEISTGNVITLAGTAGVAGYNGGSGLAATFNHPMGISAHSGYLVVADTFNHAIRVIDKATASVGQLAGYTSAGPTSDLYSPYGITTDGTNLYVADTIHQVIRKVLISSGTLTTLAGTLGSAGDSDGMGTSAAFRRPFHVTTDGSSVYVADHDNNTIREIVISSGSVSTLAGNPNQNSGMGYINGVGTAAKFDGPTGIVKLGTKLYVTETMNHVIRVLDLLTNVVSTLAGTPLTPGWKDGTGVGATQFSQPFGITTDGTDLYVADASNYVIRKVTTSGVVTTLAGSAGILGAADGVGTSARFNFPTGISTDGTSLFVTDNLNSTIRKVDIATGIVTTYAGTPGSGGFIDSSGSATRFDRPFGLVWDSVNQCVFVVDTFNYMIRKIQ